MAELAMRALGLGPRASSGPDRDMTYLIGFSVVLILLGIFLVSVMNHKGPGAMILVLGLALGGLAFNTIQKAQPQK
jgi:hypothetical protein